MAKTLLNLIDEAGQPVPADVRAAVTRAYRYIAPRFRRIDDAVLAGFAEALAAAMCRRAEEIRSVDQYARAAMIGKAYEWVQLHPSEKAIGTLADLEAANGTARTDDSFGAIENTVLFERMKTQLSMRDRQILVLVEQEFDTPAAIASALGLSYEAAKKALQRARDKMSALITPNGNELPSTEALPKSYRLTDPADRKITNVKS